MTAQSIIIIDSYNPMDLSFEADDVRCYCHNKSDLNVSFSGLMSAKHAQDNSHPFRKKAPNAALLQGKKISLKDKKLKMNEQPTPLHQQTPPRFLSPNFRPAIIDNQKPKVQIHPTNSKMDQHQPPQKTINFKPTFSKLPTSHPFPQIMHHQPISQKVIGPPEQLKFPIQPVRIKPEFQEIRAKQPQFEETKGQKFIKVLTKIKPQKEDNGLREVILEKKFTNENETSILSRKFEPRETESVADEEEDLRSEVLGYGWEDQELEKMSGYHPKKTIMTTTTNYH